MSNTYHHRNQRGRHRGRDLWSRRPLSDMSYCSSNKRTCRRVERNQRHSIIRKEVEDLLDLTEPIEENNLLGEEVAEDVLGDNIEYILKVLLADPQFQRVMKALAKFEEDLGE